MSRRSYGSRKFTGQLGMELDRENTCFAMQCCVCPAFGSLIESAKEESGDTQVKVDEEAQQVAARWVSVHRREKREHISHRLIQTTPYRVVPGGWT